MSGLPLDDWQFWVVSAIALGAVAVAWWRIVSRAVEGDAPCDRCAANPAPGSAARETSPPETSSTIPS
jgi:hypothetical protein